MAPATHSFTPFGCLQQTHGGAHDVATVPSATSVHAIPFNAQLPASTVEPIGQVIVSGTHPHGVQTSIRDDASMHFTESKLHGFVAAQSGPASAAGAGAAGAGAAAGFSAHFAPIRWNVSYSSRVTNAPQKHMIDGLLLQSSFSVVHFAPTAAESHAFPGSSSVGACALQATANNIAKQTTTNALTIETFFFIESSSAKRRTL